MTEPGCDPRALIRYALAAAVVTAAVAWAAFLVREALMLIYVSAVVAIGLGPIVAAIERLGFGGGRQRLPDGAPFSPSTRCCSARSSASER